MDVGAFFVIMARSPCFFSDAKLEIGHSVEKQSSVQPPKIMGPSNFAPGSVASLSITGGRMKKEEEERKRTYYQLPVRDNSYVLILYQVCCTVGERKKKVGIKSKTFKR